MANVRFRDAIDDDYRSFVELFHELQANAVAPTLERWRHDYRAHVIVAEETDRVVGCAFYEPFRDSGYVYQLVVSAGARRRGIALGLMTQVREEFRRRRLS